MVWGLNSSGSTVSNLYIRNNNLYGSGIYLNGTTHDLIKNNNIWVWGIYAFSMPVDNTNYTTILNNTVKNSLREDATRAHTAMPIGSSYYNNIVNNTVTNLAANGIYLSYYGSGLFQGGLCYYNNITGNTVYGGNTSWSYTIQAMGGYNNITYNTVSGGFRGISTQSDVGNYIAYNKVNASALGIYGCEGSTIINNYVDVNGIVNGIETGGNGVLIANNTINTDSGIGISIGSSNVIITTNNITTVSGYGIYGKGSYKNINITSNRINSGNTGILIKKQSSSKKINEIYIDKNIISSLKSDYAIDLYEAGAKNSEDAVITVTGANVLTSLKGNGLDKAYRTPANVTAQNQTDSNNTYVVTEKTYNTYFDIYGYVNTDKILKGDTLILNGTFTNKNFIFTNKIKVKGQKALIINGTITFTGDANEALLNNVTIRNSNQTGVELKDVYNCIISNNNIKVNQKWSSFGIYIKNCYGITVENTIVTTGDYLNYALFVYGSDINTIKGNVVRATASSIPNPYNSEVMIDSETTIKELLQNYGILLLYSSSNIVENNDVKMTSDFKSYTPLTEECKNSVVGIDIYYDSQNNKVINNKIVVDTRAPYSYGMGVLGAPWGSNIEVLNATNNQFLNNTVFVTGGYFATGFIAGLNSVNTTLNNNRITVTAKHNKTAMGDYTYGITLESSQNSTITNNRVVSTSTAVYSLESFDSNNNIITGNIIKGTGTYTYGIVGYRSSNNNISNNIISLNKKFVGNVSLATHSDAIPYGDAGIELNTNSFNNYLSYNYIDVTNQDNAIVLTNQTANNKVIQNSLNSAKSSGDNAVLNGQKSNIISYNFRYFVKMCAKSASAYTGNNIKLIAKFGVKTNDTTNLTAVFKFGSTVVGTSKVVNGVATVTYKIPSTWRATTYDLKVYVSGNNFQNMSAQSKVTIKKTLDPTVTTVDKILTTAGKTVTLKAKVLDKYNDKMVGNVTFKVNGQTIGKSILSMGTATISYIVPTNMAGKELKIEAIYSGNDQYKTSTGTNIIGVQLPVTITGTNSIAQPGNTTIFTAKVLQNGKSVSTGTVSVLLNGTIIGQSTVNNGIATISYKIPSTMDSNNYTINYVYSGTNTLQSTKTTNKLTVNPFTTIILANNVTANVGDKVILRANVFDNSKKYNATGGNITFYLNSKILTSVKVVNGTAAISFTVPVGLVGTNTISYVYNGNSQFTPANLTLNRGLIINTKTATSSLKFATC
jgi:hypothetical protein